MGERTFTQNQFRTSIFVWTKRSIIVPTQFLSVLLSSWNNFFDSGIFVSFYRITDPSKNNRKEM